ncbi:ComF family protein [Streptomyces rishiriensis]|uniref:Amidophosphoribosyltransferase n=1 Tax=Streptomyces rishiriensis TaxID=68264 RepID=A0ABU0NS74_STRRH|nr:ComF family protein [Streptomyces rishiriensis]MDQ0581397.1 putative amidophosphoribosyltransferase [Streptomyces rishiriensis]
MESVRRWWQELAGLVLPAECGGCGSARTVLCPQCRAVLGGAAPFRVRPVPEPPGLPAVHAAARYADEVRAALLAHKERGALALARPLGTALAGAVRAGVGEVGWGEGEGPQPPGHLLLVPVPSTRAAVRARGHDPARRIALAAAGELRRAGVPARVAAVLRQRRAVADQSGLDSRQRLDNLVGALTVVPGGARVLCGGPVVLVDDVVTTGASLAEAARAVRAAVQATAVRPGAVRSGAVASAAAGAAAAAAEWAGQGESGRCEEEAKRALCGEGATAGYVGRTREDSERLSGAEEGGADEVSVRPLEDAGRAADVLCAAVVAASPDSFEINRN